MDLIELHNEKLAREFPYNRIIKFSVVKEDGDTKPNKVIIHLALLDNKDYAYLKSLITKRKRMGFVYKERKFLGTPVRFTAKLGDGTSGFFIENVTWSGRTLLDHCEGAWHSHGFD